MALEYIIYCDESAEKGVHFSDFYGGTLISSKHLTHVLRELVLAKNTATPDGRTPIATGV